MLRVVRAVALCLLPWVWVGLLILAVLIVLVTLFLLCVRILLCF